MDVGDVECRWCKAGADKAAVDFPPDLLEDTDQARALLAEEKQFNRARRTTQRGGPILGARSQSKATTRFEGLSEYLLVTISGQAHLTDDDSELNVTAHCVPGTAPCIYECLAQIRSTPGHFVTYGRFGDRFLRIDDEHVTFV